MSKEFKLLYSICRVHLNQGQLDLLKEEVIGGKLNWRKLIERANKEAVTPFLYQHINSNGLSAYVPVDILEELKGIYYENLRRNTVIAERIKYFLESFNAGKIPVIMLKGILLAENIYKNIALRPVSDADILIKREDLPRVDALLKSLGYFSAVYADDFIRQGRKIITPVNSIVYSKKGEDFVIHLHWHIINLSWPFESWAERIDMSWIWQGSVEVRLNGIETRSLSPEQMLIYICLHSFTHEFRKFISACDIIEALEHFKQEINWVELLDEVKRFGLEDVLYYALFYAGKRLSYEIPRLKDLRPGKYSWWQNCIGIVPQSFYLTFLFLQKGIKGKLGFLKRTVFPSSYTMAHQRDCRLSEVGPGHYFRRFCRNLFLGIFGKIMVFAVSLFAVFLLAETCIYFFTDLGCSPDKQWKDTYNGWMNCYPTNPRNYFPLTRYDPQSHRNIYCVTCEPAKRKAGYFPQRLKQVALIGDSFTFGEGVKDEDTLAYLLGVGIPEINFRNFGEPGANVVEIKDVAALLLKEEKQIKDIVYFYNLNDVIMADEVYKKQHYIIDFENVVWDPRHNRLQRILAKSALFTMLEKAIVMRIETRQTIDNYLEMYFGQANSLELTKTLESIAQINTLCSENGVRFCLAIYPFMYKDAAGNYPFLKIHELLSAFCRKRNIRCIDGLSAFDGYSNLKQFTVHPIDFHPNELANHLMANYLIRMRLLDSSAE